MLEVKFPDTFLPVDSAIERLFMVKELYPGFSDALRTAGAEERRRLKAEIIARLASQYGLSFTNAIFEEISGFEENLEMVDFSGSIWRNEIMMHAYIARLKAINRLLRECKSLASCGTREALLSGLSGESFSHVFGSLNAVLFEQSKLSSAFFAGSKIDLTSFIGADLRESLFFNNTFGSSDFSQADLTGVLFLNCHLSSGVDFSDANMTDTEFINCWAWSDSLPVGVDSTKFQVCSSDLRPEGPLFDTVQQRPTSC